MFRSYLNFNYKFFSFDYVFNNIKDEKIKKEVFIEFGKIINSLNDRKNITVAKLIEYNLFYFLTKDEIKEGLKNNSKSDNVYTINKYFNYNYNNDKTLSFKDVKEFHPIFEQNKLKERHIDILNYNELKRFDNDNINLFLSEDNDKYFKNEKNKPLLNSFLRNNTLTTEQLKKVFFRGNYYYVSDLEMLKEILKLNLNTLNKITSINDELLTYENISKLDKNEFLNIMEFYDLKEEIIKKLFESNKKIVLKSLYIYKNNCLDNKEKEYIENNNILTQKELISFKELKIDEIETLLQTYINDFYNNDEKIKKKSLNDISLLIKKQKLSDKQVKDVINLKTTLLSNILIKNQDINEDIIKQNIKTLPTLPVLEYQNISKDLLEYFLQKNVLTTFKQFILIMNNSKYKQLNNLIINKFYELKNKKLKDVTKTKRLVEFDFDFSIDFDFSNKYDSINNYYDNSILEYHFLNSEIISNYINKTKEEGKYLDNNILDKENISNDDMLKSLSSELHILKDITNNFNFFIKNKDRNILDRIYLIIKNLEVFKDSNYNKQNDLFVTILNLSIIEVFKRRNLEISKEVFYDFKTKEMNYHKYDFSQVNFIDHKIKNPLKFLKSNDISLI